MLTNFFRINFPYGLTQNEKGEWFAFNKEYCPLGFNNLDYQVTIDESNNILENLPIYTAYKNLNIAFVKKLISIDKDYKAVQCTEDGTIKYIFLYDESTNPVNQKKTDNLLIKIYFDKLRLLSNLKKEELSIDSIPLKYGFKTSNEYDGERCNFEAKIRKESSKDIQLDFLENFIENIEKDNYTSKDFENFRPLFWTHFPDEYIDLFRVFNRILLSKEEYLPKAKKYLELLKLHSYEETIKKIYRK